LGNRPIKVNTIRTTVIGVRPIPSLAPDTVGQSVSLEAARLGARSVYMLGEMISCPIYQRDHLPIGATLAGPAVIEQADTTTLVEPGMTVNVDTDGNLILTEA
jgi:N-methylhydantoinase A